MQLRHRAVSHQGTHQPSRISPWEETHAQRSLSILGSHPTVVYCRDTHPLSRQRSREENKRMNSSPMLSTTPILLKPVRRVCNQSKNKWFWVGSLLHSEKSGFTFTNLSAKVGPNFSNQTSRLNLTFSRLAVGLNDLQRSLPTLMIWWRQGRVFY